ncbi:hypothetical protein [Francisella salimarina]|uniref:hypothetical protein n=1 Tax=Francisella salimarina TaxID=2599927 RepID=UPI0037517FB1
MHTLPYLSYCSCKDNAWFGFGCTFVGVLYVVQTNFSDHQFAFFSSLSQSIANIFAGMLALFAGKALSQYSYTYVFDILAVMFIICTIGLSILLTS